MRIILILAPALLGASPALAQSAPPPILPPMLTDPALADRLGAVAGALTRSLMNLPVGEVEAAIEGRPVTREDRRRTVGDSVGGPGVEEQVERQAAASGRALQGAGQAIARSLPAIMQAVDGLERDLGRVIGNLPDPYYPRR